MYKVAYNYNFFYRPDNKLFRLGVELAILFLPTYFMAYKLVPRVKQAKYKIQIRYWYRGLTIEIRNLGK